MTEAGKAERIARIRALTDMARTMLTSGTDADQVAKELLQHTDSPISAIKAVADATGMSLGDAKWVVHRNLYPEVREAAEKFWDDLLDGVDRSQEPTARPIRPVEPVKRGDAARDLPPR